MEDAGNLHAGSFEKSAPRNFAMQKDMQKRWADGCIFRIRKCQWFIAMTRI
jgi:hypothetical protein